LTEQATAVDLEAERLEALISLVFEDRHYSSQCNCISCRQTRDNISPEDLRFVHRVEAIMRTWSHP
jgi:hypothetical protein